ncbi:MAG: hypothetical protein GWO08_19605, partial [Gammaproteobacteria bacterium]|nr:hypothetical protein [Gammaproteobacteria bacterium]NIW11381.1 hypothetical protein [Gammaproteobacteria bacterium]
MNTIMRITVITLILFGLLSIDFVGLSLSETVAVVPGMLLLVALVDTIIIAYAINRSRWHRWRLIAAVFVIFYSLTTLLVGVETLYLGDILPPEQVYRLFLNGAIAAAIFSPLVVLAFGRLTTRVSGIPGSGGQVAVSWRFWPVKLAFLAVFWVILFVAFGLLVFTPLVNALDPAALDFYTDLEMPPWILLFQAGRGVALAGLALLIISMIRGRRWQVGLV